MKIRMEIINDAKECAFLKAKEGLTGKQHNSFLSENINVYSILVENKKSVGVKQDKRSVCYRKLYQKYRKCILFYRWQY